MSDEEFPSDPSRAAGGPVLNAGLEEYVRQAVTATPAWERPIAELRAGAESEVTAIWGVLPEVARIDDLLIEGTSIHIRIYRPDSQGSVPLLVWLHGGGWAVGSIESHEPVCRYLAAATPCCVVAVDYALAPEHPFPAGIEDSWAAVAWAASQARSLGADPTRVVVGGDSAGGNLAAVIARRARDRGLSLAAQVLVYPVATASFDTASYRRYGAGLNLSQAKMEWYLRLYLNGAEPEHPDVAPVLAPDLHGVAPALIQIAEYDPLCSDGEAYASRLREDGVPVQLTLYEGMIHGFVRMPALTQFALEALDEIAETLRTVQARSSDAA